MRDTTPPTVILVTPANGATGISTVTDMMAAFSEPIDPATLTTSSFVLRDPAGVSVGAAVGYGEATRVATLTPSAPLAGLTTYTATISTAVKDVAGNALATSGRLVLHHRRRHHPRSANPVRRTGQSDRSSSPISA